MILVCPAVWSMGPTPAHAEPRHQEVQRNSAVLLPSLQTLNISSVLYYHILGQHRLRLSLKAIIALAGSHILESPSISVLISFDCDSKFSGDCHMFIQTSTSIRRPCNMSRTNWLFIHDMPSLGILAGLLFPLKPQPRCLSVYFQHINLIYARSDT